MYYFVRALHCTYQQPETFLFSQQILSSIYSVAEQHFFSDLQLRIQTRGQTQKSHYSTPKQSRKSSVINQNNLRSMTMSRAWLKSKGVGGGGWCHLYSGPAKHWLALFIYHAPHWDVQTIKPFQIMATVRAPLKKTCPPCLQTGITPWLMTWSECILQDLILMSLFLLPGRHWRLINACPRNVSVVLLWFCSHSDNKMWLTICSISVINN